MKKQPDKKKRGASIYSDAREALYKNSPPSVKALAKESASRSRERRRTEWLANRDKASDDFAS